MEINILTKALNNIFGRKLNGIQATSTQPWLKGHNLCTQYILEFQQLYKFQSINFVYIFLIKPKKTFFGKQKVHSCMQVLMKSTHHHTRFCSLLPKEKDPSGVLCIVDNYYANFCSTWLEVQHYLVLVFGKNYPGPFCCMGSYCNNE